MSGGGQEIFSVLHHINPRKEAVLLRTYIAKRLLALIPVMLVVASVVFTIIHLAPGNPAQVILGEEAHPDEVAALAHEMGYDRPLPVQLGKWFVRLSRGDLGSSVYYGKPVSSIVFQHAAPTIQLTLMAVMINILLGLVMGVLAAAYHNTLIDNSLMFIASIKVSLPISWLGLMLMLLFALKLKWFPVSGYVAFFEDPLKSVVYMFLPAFALGAGAAARLARMTRATMLEVLRSDYIRTARAKGVSEGSILFRHALKNCPHCYGSRTFNGEHDGRSSCYRDHIRYSGIGKITYNICLQPGLSRDPGSGVIHFAGVCACKSVYRHHLRDHRSQDILLKPGDSNEKQRPETG
jgi:peptide/nickel transport system permease protein